MADILIVEDKESLRTMLRKTLQARGYEVDEAGDAYEARRRLQSFRYLVVLTDLRLPAGSGFDVLKAARDADPETPVVVMTAFGTVEEAVRAMKEGATDFLMKPVDTDHLQLLLDRAVEKRRLITELVLLREDYQRRFGLPKVIGEDPALKEAMLALQRAAATDTTVLLQGESGTGKELMSRALHQLSARASGPFVAINCAAIPEALLENELFGHEKGAFTGATGRKVGKAELAHKGTLFLDEIGDMPLLLQGKILRLVQEKQFERVGGLQTLKVDVRVVAATNRDLRTLVEQKLFREDLYFRLSVLPIEIPPLRRRRRDIPLLADAFVQRLSRDLGRKDLRLTDEAKRVLCEQPWPGNVRELQNCLERAAILCDGPTIGPAQLRLDAAFRSGPGLGDVLDLTGPLAECRRAGDGAGRGGGDRGGPARDRGRPRGGGRAPRDQPLDAESAAEALPCERCRPPEARPANGEPTSGSRSARQATRRAASERPYSGCFFHFERWLADEDPLAQADRGRDHLHELVLLDELERLLEVELAVRCEPDRLVGRRGPHVRELLLLRDVHVHVVGPGVLAHDHPLVDGGPGPDEQLAAVLHVRERVGRRVAAAIGHQHARLAAGDLALPLDPALEDAVHDRRAARVGEQLRADSDQAAGRDREVDAHAAGAVVHHLRHLALAQRHLLEHDAHVGLGQVDAEELERLLAHAVLQCA